MKFLSLSFVLLTAFTSHARAESDYCLAIRGNGENVAAHWPALGRLVEENGLPAATAGGSSASVSMFFLDSLAGNPALNGESDLAKRRKMQGLLLKSLPEFVTLMARHDRLPDVFSFMQEMKNKDSSAVERAVKALAGKGAFASGDVSRIFQKYAPLVNPEMVKGLTAKPEFFRAEALSAVKVFGQFNARDDRNLFVRPGLVDFKYFALILGAVADFYAGNADASSANGLAAFAASCAEESYRKPWHELSAGCRGKFGEVVGNYLARGDFPNKALFTRAGHNLRSFPSTAVLKNAAAGRYRKLRETYFQGDAKADYAGFTVDFTKDELGFAYWGKAAELKKVERGIAAFASAGDEKAKRFTALGSANWFEVLATSPAEPGLASIQEIPVNTTRDQVLSALNRPMAERWDALTYSQEYVSAGGWSDLHPTGVLRAAGCEHVAYLTRKDGDAIFGQQVFIRLTGLTKVLAFWDKLGDRNNDGWKVDGEAAATPWNALYNLGNPTSSFNRSLKLADAVYCTDWNHFKVFGGEMDAMVKEAYGAPVFLNAGGLKALQVNPEARGDFPGCQAK